MSAFITRVQRLNIIGALLMGVFVVLGISLLSSSVKAAPGINQQLNFQGRLLTASGATVADGYYNIQFKIYQDGTGTVAGNPSGTLKWTESWLNASGNGVQVKNGYLSVQLGSITSLSSVDWNQDTLWLSINVGNTNVSCTPFTSCSGDGEMLPMKRLGSTPYAFNAGQLGGLTSAQFLQLAQGVQTEAGTNTNSIAINKTGTGNFLNLQASGVDVFKITNAGDITFGNNIDHAISVSTAAASTAGKALTISAGTAGTGATALTGGTLTLQGGNGGGTGGNGGNLVLDAGAAAAGGTGGTITIGGTNASSITLGQNTTVSGGKALTITGSGTRPSSPTEGMIYYDTTTKQLIVYSNGKWQSDRSDTTKIVAATNSSQAAKDAADYIATGTSDQSTINTALTAAAGGKVYLMEGTYTTDDKISIPNNTTLAGAGRNTLIQLSNINGQTKNMIENTDQGGTTGEGVVIRDLRLDGLNGTNLTGTMYGIYMNSMGGASGASARSGATITNVWVMNMLNDGIRFNNSPNGSITNSTVQGGKANGIYLSSSNRMEVGNNTVQGNTGGGIWLAGAVNVTVTGNVLNANGTSGISLNGSSHDNTISSNNLSNNGGTGANNSITLSSVNNNQIIGNSIVDNGGTGAAIGIDSASASNYLSNNVFNGTGATSISDASTTTIYANQSRATTGGQITNRTANDAQAFAVQNATGSNIFAVDTTNSQVVLGNSTTAGKLNISDGSSNTGTIVVGPLSGNYTYTIPTTTADDTFCLVTLNNCAANSALFIQNQNSAVQTSSNFWISGTGRADTSLLTPTVDTATGVTLNIGTTSATAVSIGKAATTTTIHGNLGVTLNATTGTTITCQNASGYLSVCDSSVLTPSAANFIQNGTSVQTGANFWIDGYGKIAGGVQTGNIDTIGAAGSLNIGTTNAGSLTIGKTGVTTTIQGNIGVTLNATTGTTMVCRNATGLLSSCDATYQAPTSTNFIQNQATTPGSAQTANFNITGTGMAGTLQATNVIGTTFDTASASALNIGASGTPTATSINLNQSATVATGKTLTLAGDTRANIGSIASPTEGMMTYDTTNKQLLVYSNGKWQADRSTASKIVGTSASGGASGAVASINADGADYVNASATSAQTVINSALSSIGTNGGVIYLMEGTYIIDGSISIPNNVTLMGAGSGTVIKLKNAINANIDAIVATDTTTGTGITISDLRIDGNKANNTAGTQDGVYLNNVGSGNGSTARQGFTIRDLWISNLRNYGIWLDTLANGTVSGTHVNGTSFGLYAKSTASGNQINLTITGNTFQGNTRGIYTEGMLRSTISGNTIEGNTYGLWLSGTSNDNTVTGNSINRNSNSGLTLNTAANTTVSGNRFLDNGGSTTNEAIVIAGSTSTGNTITGNTITDASASSNNNAIDVTDATSTGNYISSNTIGTGIIADAAAAGNTYGGQMNGSGNYTVQPASGTIELMKNTNVTGTLSASTSVLSPSIDRATAGTLSIGTNGTNTTALTIGSASVTTTIQGNVGVTLNATTGTTMVCRNATGLLSSCDATYLTPTATNFIQNQATTPGSAQTANFNITGTGIAGILQAATVNGTTFDTATGVALNIGTSGTPTTTGINLNQSVTVAATKTLRITGDTRANITSIGSPTEGMMSYDTTNKQLLVYANGKWQADQTGVTLVAASDSSQADKDAANYVGDGNTAAAGDGDQVQIAQGIADADPAGSGRKTGKVYLFPGTYTIDAGISLPNNITFSGAGSGTVITIPNAVNASFTAITNATTGGNGTGIVIQDLKLDGNKANQSAGSYGMYGINFNGMGSGTLAGGKIQNVWVTNWYGNGVTSWTYAGIYISTGSHNVINNVVAQSNTNNGIAITGTYTTLTGSDFTGNNYGIHLSSNNNTITGNTSAGNTANGIYLENASQNTVTGNVATGNTTTNIYLSGSSSNTISGNQALGSSSNDGVGLSSTSTYNIISGNIIQANSTGGVSIASTSTNNTITNNKIHNNGGNNNKGVYFSNSNNNTVTNNVISDLTTTASNNPINIDVNSANTYLSGNYFSSTAANGTIADASTTTVYVNQPKSEGGGQITNRVANDTAAFAFQKADGTNVLTVDTSNSKVLIAGTLDTTTATTLNIGTATATAISIGKAGITTTIAGDTGVTLNGTTGTTMVCRNATGLLSGCDATYLTPTANNFIQNQNASAQTTANFWISGTGQAATLTAGTVNATTSLVTPSIDAASAVALSLGGTTASSVDIGKSAGTVNLKANSTLVGTSGGTITIQGATQSTANTAGNQFTLKGSTGNGSGAGGQLTIQGGDGGATSGANGGNLLLTGGTGTGTGVNGLVVFTTPTFSTVTNDTNCFTGGSPVAASCSIAASSVNGSSAILVGFSTDGQTATLPDPTITTAGRVVYVTASNTSSDFTLSVNGGGQGNQIAMRKNTTATMIWNGADWTAAGASSSTTLQAAYDNTLQSAGGAELVVSKTSATNGLTIRDSSANSVNGALLTVQSSSAANLFSVNSNVTEYATDAGAEVYGATTTTFPANTWSALTSTTLTRYTTAGDFIATGQGSVSANVTAATANAGVANKLSSALTPNMTYNVSFSARLASGTFTDMSVYYSVDGTAASVACASNQTAKTSIWSKITCTFQAPSSGITANNAILIRQATGVIRTFYIDNLSVTIAADYNYATDGDVDDNAAFATNWPYTTGTGTGTTTRNTSDGFNASSSATVAISAGAANAGGRNKLSINPLTGTLYRISIYAKAATTFNDFKVRYSPDGGTNFVDCVDYNTQIISTSTWTQITCYIKTGATTVSNPYVYFVETASAARTYYLDAFSMTLASNTTPNVQIGSGSNGGPTTLLTVDKGSSAPIAANNDALLGSMYYDTTLGKLQCYEADGWGACGSSPDNIVTISPEYTNAVMHGTGIGTMTSDLCSSTLNINDGTGGQSTICGTNETYNFYKWTSPQATPQTYSIYVTYQLPGTFKEFSSGSTSIMGRTDSASSTVQYQIYRSNSATGMTACGSAVTVSTGVKTSWQPGQATGAADPSTCGFTASDSIVFKISMTSSSNANAYVGNLGFTFSNR